MKILLLITGFAVWINMQASATTPELHCYQHLITPLQGIHPGMESLLFPSGDADFPHKLQRSRTLLKVKSHIMKMRKKKLSKIRFCLSLALSYPNNPFFGTDSNLRCSTGIPKKNLLLCLMRDVSIQPFHCRWHICIKFLWLFIIAVFCNICNCAHFHLNFHPTGGNDEKPSGMATKKYICLSCEHTNSPQSPALCTQSLFFSENLGRAVVLAPVMKSTGSAGESVWPKSCQLLWFYPDLFLKFESEWTFWLYPGNPLGICLLLYKELSPGRSVMSPIT